ncbi:unnamed protein product, partial [Mesorhabditis belari]|uniref:Uncharacterized protein n=1 Tax=Mesorhabditis belari TaxID=2138241 RepID=A0AAF3EHZ5_9BILA
MMVIVMVTVTVALSPSIMHEKQMNPVVFDMALIAWEKYWKKAGCFDQCQATLISGSAGCRCWKLSKGANRRLALQLKLLRNTLSRG